MSEQFQKPQEEIHSTKRITAREVLDPQGTLPNVSIEDPLNVIKPKGTLLPEKKNIVHEGNIIGSLTLVADKRNKRCWFNGITVEEGYRGKGFGLATYVSVIEQASDLGFTFATHEWSQTEQAKRIWEQLAENDIATAVEPFKPDGNGKYVGVYEILVKDKSA